MTGLDDPADALVPGALPAHLSPLRRRPDHPEWDVAVWVDIISVPGTPYQDEFYREMEQWMLGHYSGSYAVVRPEWSKRFAHTSSGPWTDAAMLGATIPQLYRSGYPSSDNWDTARATLHALDPHGVFGSAFLDALLP